MEEDFSERWDRFVDRLVDGGCVPLAGAGVSIGSSDPLDGSFRPTVEWMKERVLDRLADWATRLSSSDPQARAALACALAALQDGGAARLDRLAEVLACQTSQREVVGRIGLLQMTRMRTLPAHRYLARLAREGFVSEILTTNYDTCLERAYRATFAHSRDLMSWPAVICTLEDFRRAGSARRLDGPWSDEPVLRIFKLNGCAGRWVEWREKVARSEPRAGEEPSILLTDFDLRAMEERWKAEHVRGLMRTRTLVLTGFGSDEPQVRNLALDIAQEGGKSGDGQEQADPRWPLVVAGHEREPSFVQQQVLRAFFHPWDGEQGFFGGRDAGKFGEEGATLSADAFWRHAYRSSMVLAVEHQLRRAGNPVRQAIDAWSGCTLSGGSAPRGLADWLRVGTSASTAPMCWLWDELPGDGQDRSLRVQAILREAQGLPAERPEHVGTTDCFEYYRPIHQDRAVGLLLAALWRLGATRPSDEVPVPPAIVEATGASGSEKRRFVLLVDLRGGSGRSPRQLALRSPVPAVALVVDGDGPQPPKDVRVVIAEDGRNGNPGALRSFSVPAIPLAALDWAGPELRSVTVQDLLDLRGRERDRSSLMQPPPESKATSGTQPHREAGRGRLREVS